jgi:hypothetical protein
MWRVVAVEVHRHDDAKEAAQFRHMATIVRCRHDLEPTSLGTEAESGQWASPLSDVIRTFTDLAAVCSSACRRISVHHGARREIQWSPVRTRSTTLVSRGLVRAEVERAHRGGVLCSVSGNSSCAGWARTGLTEGRRNLRPLLLRLSRRGGRAVRRLASGTAADRCLPRAARTKRSRFNSVRIDATRPSRC